MKPVKALGCLLAALAALSAPASAQPLAYAAKDIHLRAGPSRNYPVVAILRAGVAVSVEGCLSDYRWCDVVVAPYRGWVYARNIVYPYQGGHVPVLDYGHLIGIGIIDFSLGVYWDAHYHASPWYPQRQFWIDRPRPIFRPGGPRPPPPRPPAGPGVAPRTPLVQPPAGAPHPRQFRAPAGVQRPAPGPAPRHVQRPSRGERPGSGQPRPPGPASERPRQP